MTKTLFLFQNVMRVSPHTLLDGSVPMALGASCPATFQNLCTAFHIVCPGDNAALGQALSPSVIPTWTTVAESLQGSYRKQSGITAAQGC